MHIFPFSLSRIDQLSGRDDRVISSTGRESRIPYLDEVRFFAQYIVVVKRSLKYLHIGGNSLSQQDTFVGSVRYAPKAWCR